MLRETHQGGAGDGPAHRAVKTLASFDFSFRPSLDRNRMLTLTQLELMDRKEVLHVLGPPATGRFGKRSLEEIDSFGDLAGR